MRGRGERENDIPQENVGVINCLFLCVLQKNIILRILKYNKESYFSLFFAKYIFLKISKNILNQKWVYASTRVHMRTAHRTHKTIKTATNNLITDRKSSPQHNTNLNLEHKCQMKIKPWHR